MGATNIYLEIEADSLQSAYQSAYDQAVYEHGHNEYNGTISTTEGVIDKTDVFDRIVEGNKGNTNKDTCSSVDAWCDEALDNTHKWDVVWGAKLEDNRYILAGWAAT